MQALDGLAVYPIYIRLIILLVVGCLLLQIEYLLLLAPIKKSYVANKKAYEIQQHKLKQLKEENKRYMQALRLKQDLGQRFHQSLDHNTLLLRLVKGSMCDFGSVKRVKSGFQFGGHGDYAAVLVLLKKLESIHAFLQSIVFKKVQSNEPPVIYLQVHAN